MSQFLFINPSTHKFKGTTSVVLTVPPLGLASMAAVLESSGHAVQIIDANVEQIDPEDIVSRVASAPAVIGLTVNILSIRMALQYGKVLKDAFPEALLVLGGPQASTLKGQLLEKSAFVDAVIVGEGEVTIAEIAQRLGSKDVFKDVSGVVYRDQGLIIDNGLRPFIQDVDSIPIPAYHLLPHLSHYRSRSRATPVGFIVTSRGCPSACTFCYRSFGDKWRARSPEKVIEEIALLREVYGIRQLDILDDNFIADKVRTVKILEMIIARQWNLKINLQIGVRVHSLDFELLKLMKRAGVFKFGFGIESGDEAMLRRIKKGLSLDKAIEVVRDARSLGLITHGYFIIGFPGDTPESMQKTIDYAKKLDAHYASFSVCAPLPGTEMMQDILDNGTLVHDVNEGIDEGLFALKVFFHYRGQDPDQIVHYCDKAWKEFYFRPGKMGDVLTTIKSWGELTWLVRVLRDVLRTKNS